MRTLGEQISKSLLVERLIASLSTVFGFLATLLAIIGLYGVMAFTVARRTREIGIRMALGAFQKHVIWMVMREVLALVSIGIGAGLAGAIGLTRLVQAQLYGITAHDPATLARGGAGIGGRGRSSRIYTGVAGQPGGRAGSVEIRVEGRQHPPTEALAADPDAPAENRPLPYDDVLVTRELKARKGFITDPVQLEKAISLPVPRERVTADVLEAIRAPG